MKHRKSIFILLTALLALQIISVPGSAEYTGPNGGARRYSYEVEVPGTCSEEYSCCTWWSDDPCGSNPWDVGCCLSYGTCSREYDCTTTETVWANHPDATIATSPSCTTGFGANNWCRGDVTVNLTGTDEWQGINGFESSDGHHLSKGGGHTETGSVSFSGEQNRSVDFWALSTFGDTSTKKSENIRIDKTSPESVGIRVEGTKGPGNAYRGKVTFVGTATDSMAGVKSIFVDLKLGEGEKAGSASVPANYTGVVTPCVRAVDNAGNSTACINQASTTVDNTLPYVTEYTRLDPSVIYNGSSQFSVTGADDLSGMYSVSIVIDSTPFTARGNSNTVGLGSLGDGNHTISIELTDNAGNVYNSSNDSRIGTIPFIADVTPPTVTLSKPDDNSFVNGEISVVGTAGDNIGLSKVVYYIDSTAFGETSISGTSASFSKVLNTADLSEGKHTLSVIAVDRGGNESAAAKKTFTVDHTYPVNDIEISGNISGGWYYGPVTITSVAQDTYLDKQWVDAGFGQKENADTIPATFSGTVTPKSKSVDLAGNLSDWTAFEPIRIDNEKPVITNFIDPKGKWFNYPVPLSVSGTDQYSGVRTGYIVVDGKTMDVNGNTSSLAYSGSQGMHEVNYQLEDFASNKSAISGPYSFGFDTVLPVIKLDSNQSFDIIGPVVTISGTVTDNASGIKNVQIKYGAGGSWTNVSGQPSSGTLDGSWSHKLPQDVAEGYNNFFVRTTDVAGNVSQVVTFTLRTDKTHPETVGLRVEGQKGPGEAYRGKVTFIGEAEDSVAGVKSIFVDLGLGGGEKPDSDSVAAGYSGVVTACVRAVDNVGNSTECIPQNPVTVDNEKPYQKHYTRLDPAVVYKGADIFSVTGADDLSGMYSAAILLDEIPYTAMGESVSIELGAQGNGTHTISFLLTDNAGNVYDSKDDPNVGMITFSVDSEPPSVVLSKPDDGEYVNQSVTAGGTAADNIGLAKIEYLIDGSGTAEETLSGTSASFSKNLDTSALPDGTHTVSVIVTDKAGNQSDPVQKSFIVDHTPPACHIEVYGTRGDGGFFRGEVTLKAVCSDDGSGVDETFINTGDGRVPSETIIPDDFSGNVTPLVAGIDKAGNDSGDLPGDMIFMPDGTPISTILVDNTPPVVTGYYEPSSRWLNIETIDLFVTGHDNEGPLYSGTIILNGKPYDIRTESDRAEMAAEIPEGISSLKYYVTDLAGNRSGIIGN
ncbi:MAG: Ig-like domain repeat protein [Anaerolineaceae bacterium]|nr:Ig-like domain repeat protein [Anaerolineaceae bacterium]